MRRSMAVVTWTVATVGACALAWSAVDRVASEVTTRTPIVGDQSIRASLRKHRADHPTVGTGSLAVPTTAPGAPTPTNADGTPSDAGSASPGGGGGRSGTDQNGTGAVGPTNGNDPNPAPGSSTPPTTAPSLPPPPSPSPGSGNASTFVVGGSVTASCSAGLPRLVGAIPADGFAVAVSSGGGQLVVDFTSDTHHSIVEAECEAGTVQYSTGEESAG